MDQDSEYLADPELTKKGFVAHNPDVLRRVSAERAPGYMEALERLAIKKGRYWYFSSEDLRAISAKYNPHYVENTQKEQPKTPSTILDEFSKIFNNVLDLSSQLEYVEYNDIRSAYAAERDKLEAECTRCEIARVKKKYAMQVKQRFEQQHGSPI